MSNLQASGERITGLSIRRNVELTARDLGCGIRLLSLTGLDDLTVLVDPLDVVIQVLCDRQTGSVGLNLITDVRPVVGSVLVNNVKLQSLRSKDNVPAGVGISGVTDEGTVATEELCVSTSFQISTEAWACPLAKGPRVQRTDVVRQRLAVLAKNADVAPVHVDMLGARKAVTPIALTVGASQLAKLVCRHKSTRLVVIAIETLPPQLEFTVCTGGGGHGFCNPAFRISSYLLINPLLQALLIGRSPPLAT